MLIYSPEEIRKHTTLILGSSDVVLQGIGNHELGRHLVYKVTMAHKPPMVIKLYCKPNRRSREMAALTLLANTEVKSTEILKAGVLPDGTEWLLTTFVHGKTLDRVWDQMSPEQENMMFESLGDELGKIHGASTFPFFGHWDENGQSLRDFRHYFTEFVRSSEYVFNHLHRQNLPDRVLLERAIDIIRRNYSIVDGVRESRLTHHDYDGRNILVEQHEGRWTIQGVLDFEHSCPGNREIDLAGVYARYLRGDAHRAESFFKGYTQHLPVEKDFFRRLAFYLLCKGVVICSWTYRQAPAYYAEGIRLIERYHGVV